MQPKALLIALLIFVAQVSSVSAETVIFVQGYLGSAGSWRDSGVAAVLRRFGWSDGGHLSLSQRGVISVLPPQPGSRRFVTIDLPTEAPTVAQAEMLGGYVAYVRQTFGKEPLVLVGHSVGGVVARLFMVRHPDAGIAGLVTIASPNLGASAAKMGSLIGSTPAAWFAPFFGMNTINRSQALYRDLWPEQPDTLLGWLNRAQHPPANYVSIVRTRDVSAPQQGDAWLNGYTQDLNRVPALAGHARTIVSQGNHGLRPDDGALIAGVLRAMEMN
jgi:triacylglycerol lipase